MTLKSNLLIMTSAVLLAGVLSVRVSSHVIPTETVAATTSMQAPSHLRRLRRLPIAVTPPRTTAGRRLAWPTSSRDPKAASERRAPGIVQTRPVPHLHAGRRRVRLWHESGNNGTSRNVGDDYFPLPAQWDVARNRVWRPYFVQPNAPTGGCRSIRADSMPNGRPARSATAAIRSTTTSYTNTVKEWNVGCERCHGPGSDHIAKPTVTNIVNPAETRFRPCQRHLHPVSLAGTTTAQSDRGQVRRLARGVRTRLKELKDFWELEEHKLGETTFTHFADGTAHKNRMQGNDFVQSVMYRRGVTCSSCHDAHGTANDALLIKPARDICLSCHDPSSPNGPHAPTIEAHTHHARGSAGSDCIACHMPKIEQTIANVNVRSHTFAFITPKMTDDFKIPNPARRVMPTSQRRGLEALRSWPNVSPWRGQTSDDPSRRSNRATCLAHYRR